MLAPVLPLPEITRTVGLTERYGACTAADGLDIETHAAVDAPGR
jgi:hypothetical protein